MEKNKSSNSCQETVENELPILKTNPFKRKQLAITNYIPKKMSVDGQKKIDNAFIKLFT